MNTSVIIANVLPNEWQTCCQWILRAGRTPHFGRLLCRDHRKWNTSSITSRHTSVFARRKIINDLLLYDFFYDYDYSRDLCFSVENLQKKTCVTNFPNKKIYDKNESKIYLHCLWCRLYPCYDQQQYSKRNWTLSGCVDLLMLLHSTRDCTIEQNLAQKLLSYEVRIPRC